MTRLSPEDYLAHLRADSARFRAVLADCDPAARVPSCPDWSAADLLWHLAGVQWFWAKIVRERPTGPSEDDPGPERPEAYADLLAAFDEHSASLVSELERADAADPAWTWNPDDQTVGFTYRRQAHEALIHRLDAELTAGQVTTLDAALASDGVDELLGVMFGGIPPWGTFTSTGQRIRVECSDTGDAVTVETGHFTGTDPDSGKEYADELAVEPVADATDADVVIAGPAAALDAWLWRRGSDDEVTVTGDRAAYDLFREAVNHPIE